MQANIDGGVYLNDFSIDTVRRVLKKCRNVPDLIIRDGLDGHEGEFAELSYCPDFHRLHAYPFSGMLYPNPDCVALLVSEERFMKALVPSGLYHEITKI